MRREILALLVAASLSCAAPEAWSNETPAAPAPFVPISVPAPDLFLIPFEPLPPMPAKVPERPVWSEADMQTAWGYGARENLYNQAILQAVQSTWPHPEVPLPPTLFKSLIAAESAFNPQAVSATGALGLVQLTPDTARRFGLNWSTARDPRHAVPAGVRVLAEKARAVLDPARYHQLLGRKPEDCPYAARVAQAYETLGPPSTEQCWPLVLAAYNGGGGTVLRAMALAYDRGLDPRDWNNLVGDPTNPGQTPLYLACVQIYRQGAAGKYREMRQYPEKILRRYQAHQQQGAGTAN